MRNWKWQAVTVVAAIAAASGEASAGGRECAIEARVEWVDVSRLAPFAYRVMAAEARSTLSRFGICADVARVSARAVRTRDEIAVVLLGSMGGSGVGRHVLGATRTSDTGNGTVWVYLDEVVRSLGLAARAKETWTGADRMAIGRALGRVAAHEIVHVLLPERPHDDAGLMAPAFGHRELTASVLDAAPDLAADVHRIAERSSWIAHAQR